MGFENAIFARLWIKVFWYASVFSLHCTPLELMRWAHLFNNSCREHLMKHRHLRQGLIAGISMVVGRSSNSKEDSFRRLERQGSRDKGK